ncbi:MAG: ABC transporter permease [Phycisphaerae bacterium]|nr:ABC transporter permease [Phycisphaerae bacterium]
MAERRSLSDVILGPVDFLGARALAVLDHIGSLVFLLADAATWVVRGVRPRKRVRIGYAAIVSQVVRVGARSLFIISLVSSCIGLILALQLSPPLDNYGQKELVANIIGVAVLRELGPLIAAVVMTGFAGAAIAAEIGTMVVGEEIEALEAHALSPVRFLVVPRVIATLISMTALAVVADAVAIASALLTSMLALGIPASTFITNMLDQVAGVDFRTGVGKGAVFGLLIGIIACGNGLKVTGGAAGVGKATTSTVVESVVAIIIADMVFTAIFYALKWV